MIDLNTTAVEEIINYFSSKVNVLLFKPDKIAEEQKDSKQMQDLDILWIKILSGHDYRTDARNEAAAKVGRQLAEISFVKKKIEFADNPKMQEVAKKMECQHRTLQQTFSELVFYHFLQCCNKSETETLLRVMGDSFYKLPLI